MHINYSKLMKEKIQALKNRLFDENTCQSLGYYVYMLVDPRNNRPFYVGKGTNNRVFDHILQALNNCSEKKNEKLDTIRSIYNDGFEVEFLIVHHALDEKSALLVESSLIDTLNKMSVDVSLTNIQSGHDVVHGLRNDIEIRGIYNAKHIDKLPDNCVVININRVYKRGAKSEEIYNMVSGNWVIAKWRLPIIKYILAEYRGLILDVFKVSQWESVTCNYQSKSNGERERIRYKFTKDTIEEDIRNQFIGKKIPYFNKQFPLIYPERINKEMINEENQN